MHRSEYRYWGGIFIGINAILAERWIQIEQWLFRSSSTQTVKYTLLLLKSGKKKKR